MRRFCVQELRSIVIRPMCYLHASIRVSSPFSKTYTVGSLIVIIITNGISWSPNHAPIQPLGTQSKPTTFTSRSRTTFLSSSLSSNVGLLSSVDALSKSAFAASIFLSLHSRNWARAVTRTMREQQSARWNPLSYHQMNKISVPNILSKTCSTSDQR